MRVWTRALIISSSLFLLTILACASVFALFISKGAKILSPVGKQAWSVDKEIAQIKDFCQRNHINCQYVVQTDNKTIQITLDTQAKVFLSTQKDVAAQLASLQAVMTQLTIKGKQFKKLDFRFDTIIVSF